MLRSILAFSFCLFASTAWSTPLTLEQEFGGTHIVFAGCSQDGIQIRMAYKIFNYSPLDMELPEGTTRATLEETWAAAKEAFQQYIGAGLSAHQAREALTDSFAVDMASESITVEYQNEKGETKTADVSRMDAVIWATKSNLMKNQKYTGFAVNYVDSSSYMTPETICSPR